VLWGSSLQSHFTFEPAEAICDGFVVGKLTHVESSLLSRGHVEPIHAGDALIHSVFHLDAPSVSLVLRTHSSAATGIQYRYERPSVAYDPFVRDTHATKVLQIVDYLCEVRPVG
jgi:hypothetical protein